MILSPDAGEGYATENPGLTVEGYRTAFGHLDYLFRLDSDDRDEPLGGDRPQPRVPELDSEIFHACRFIVYPFVSQVIYWCVHEDEIALIRKGLEHPNSEAILAAYDAESRMNEFWVNGLSDDDREFICAIDKTDNTCIKSLPKHIKHYLELKNNTCRSFVALSDPERKRVRNCITNVRRWLEQNQGSG